MGQQPEQPQALRSESTQKQVERMTKKEKAKLLALMKEEEQKNEEKAMMPEISSITIYNVVEAEIDRNAIFLPITIESKTDKKKTIDTKALLDTGAGGKFIDQNFILAHGIKTRKLEKPITVYNVDGTKNKTGTITQYVDLNLRIGDRTMDTRLMVTGLGRQKIILGFLWFAEQNLEIDWEKGLINWRTKTETRTSATSTEILDEEEYLNRTQNPLDEDEESSSISLINVNGKVEPIWINAKTNLAMDMAIEENLKKKELPITELVPPEYHEFLDVFDEEKANRFPESKKWDHKIDMKEGFEPKSFKNYNLTPEEQVELDIFLKENLEKGYIRPSQSPIASPFFFVKKKDGKL